MKNKWVRNSLIAGAVSLLAIGTGYLAFRGTSKGIIHVSNVYELQNAIRTAADYDVIVVRTLGQPYNLAELPSMHTNGYLYVTNSITIKGETGNPNDVIIYSNPNGVSGSTNRILYVKAPGFKISGLTLMYGNRSSGGETGSAFYGGGIFLAMATNECLISNCWFRENRALRGGAIACAKEGDLSTIVSDCYFDSNDGGEAGGAVYNGGMLEKCTFTSNAAKSGGAVYRGELINCMGYFNYGGENGKGSELYGCTATAYRYFGMSEQSEIGNKISRFHDVLLDRCRICPTNGVLFSGDFEVRSSVIAQGTNFTLAASLKTNEVSSLINCTVADNKNYQLVKPDVKTYGNLAVLNCIFSENTSTTEWGTKVNLNFVTNRYNKSVAMTKAQRYLAFGWNGDVNADAAQTNVNVHAGETIDIVAAGYLDTTLISQPINSEYAPSRSEDVTVSYRQFYHANGWNGDETLPSFVAKANTYSIGKDNQKTYNNLMSAYSTNLTWATYYTNMGWNGSSVYTGYDYGPFDFALSMTNMFISVQGSFLKYSEGEATLDVEEAIRNSQWAHGAYVYFYFDLFSGFDFMGDRRPSDPYLITTASIACFLNDYTYYWDIIPYMADWMYYSDDLRGAPRLSNGGLDIGAYQAVEYRKPTRFIIRIR